MDSELICKMSSFHTRTIDKLIYSAPSNLLKTLKFNEKNWTNDDCWGGEERRGVGCEAVVSVAT